MGGSSPNELASQPSLYLWNMGRSDVLMELPSADAVLAVGHLNLVVVGAWVDVNRMNLELK
jgi:hypothetical protein